MKVRSWLSTLFGIALLACAVLFSNQDVARMTGRDVVSLGWGPGLFRVLLAFHGLAAMGYGWLRAAPRAVNAEPRRRIGRAWWIVGALTALALALRLYRLNTGLWL